MIRRLVNNIPHRNASVVNTSSITIVAGPCFRNCLIRGLLAILSKGICLKTGPGLKYVRYESD